MPRCGNGGKSMNNVKINNELNLTYPEEFKEMSEVELARYFGSPTNRWGVYDTDRHIILSVGWKKLSFFKSFGDEESAMIGAQARLRRNLLNYQRLGTYVIKLDKKKKARGLRFEYRVNDKKLVQVADLIIVKHKKIIYSIYYITRKANAAEARQTFRAALESVTFD